MRGPSERPLRVLIVDDNVDTASSLALLLQMWGHEVRTTHDGLSAFEVSMEFRPDAVVLDIGLPHMDGFEVARVIRERVGQSLWLVALTSRTAAADRRQSSEAGFDLHVAKPVALDRLRGVLRDIVSRAS